MRRTIGHSSLVATLAVAFVGAALAQNTRPAPGQAPQPEAQGDVTTVVYDIRGLIAAVQNYPAAHDAPNVSKSEPKERVDAYIRLLMDTIDSATWRDNGGDTGQIREIDGRLIVTQTPDAQRRIAELLTQLQDWRMVRVRAHWLVQEPEQKLFPDAAGASALRVVDSAALDKLPNEVIHGRAEIVCFAGQTVHLQSGRQHAYVSDVDPVVGTQAVASDPKVQVFEDGALLQVTPTVQPDGSSALLDVRMTLSDWAEVEPVKFDRASAVATSQPATPAMIEGAIVQRPRPVVQRLNTTLRVPLNRAVIVGGMTVEPRTSGENSRQLILIVEVLSG